MLHTLLATVIPAAGLSELWKSLLSGWVTPIFLAAVAIFAIFFIKDRRWTALISFIGIAAIVAVLIFAGPALFGDNGALTTVGEKTAKQIN